MNLDFKLSLYTGETRLLASIVSLPPDIGTNGSTHTVNGNFTVTWRMLDTPKNNKTLEQWKKL